jgi:hypothetical protein
MLAAVAQGPTLVRSVRPQASQGVDFFQEWASARNVLDAEPAYLSHEITLRRHLGLARDPADPQFITYNAHPPTSILLALPIAWLSYPDATLVWNLVSLVLIVASVVIVFRELGLPLVSWWVFPALALGLTCNPLRQTVNQGQLNGILLFLLTLAWRADRRGQDTAAGVTVALAAAIKLFPAVLMGGFLLQRRWRCLSASTITLATVSALTAGILGLDAYIAYFTEVVPDVARFQSDWCNGSLAGFWSKLFGTGAIHFGHVVEPLVHRPDLAIAATLLSCAAVVGCWARSATRARSEADRDWVFAIGLCAMLLVSPVCWDHYWLLLLLPLVVVWKRLPEHPAARGFFALLILGVWTNPLQVWAMGLPDPATAETWTIVAPLALSTLIAYPTYLLLILFAWLLHLGDRGRALTVQNCAIIRARWAAEAELADLQIPANSPILEGAAAAQYAGARLRW